jgi:Lar family restriction alleviation protein
MTDTKADPLLPCPFCGGTSIDVEEISSTSGNSHSYMISCDGCEAIAPGPNLSLEEGRKSWNTRAAFPPAVPLLNTKADVETGAHRYINWPRERFCWFKDEAQVAALAHDGKERG